MKTVVYPPPGVHGFGRTRTVAVVAHRLTAVEAAAITAKLSRDQLPVLPALDESGVVHLWPLRPMTTAEEVHVLTVVLARTDCPVHWRGAGAQGYEERDQ